MDTSRLMAMLQAFLRSHEDLPPAIYKLAQQMKGIKGVELLMSQADILKRLDTAASNMFVPSWLRMLHEVGGDGLHGGHLARRLRTILENDDYRTEHKGTLLEGVYQDLQPFIAHTGSVVSALENVGVEPDALPPGTSEIGVLFPQATVKDLEDLARETHEFDRHLRVLAELAGNPGSLALRRIETGSFNIFTLADPATGGLFAAMLAGLVALIKKVAEIRKLAAETRKINVEIAEKLESQAADERQVGIKKVTDECMQTAEISDAGRRNELELSLTHAVSYVDTKMQMNVVFEVRASAKSVSGDAPAEAALNLIRENGNALAEIAQREWQLLLPKAEDTSKKPGA